MSAHDMAAGFVAGVIAVSIAACAPVASPVALASQSGGGGTAVYVEMEPASAVDDPVEPASTMRGEEEPLELGSAGLGSRSSFGTLPQTGDEIGQAALASALAIAIGAVLAVGAGRACHAGRR